MTKMHRKLLLLVVLWLLVDPLLSIGQIDKIDSLKKELERSQNDTLRIYLTLSIAYNYWSVSPEKMLDHLKKAESMLAQVDYPSGESRLSNIYGVYYFIQGDYKNTLKYYTRALEQEINQGQLRKAAIVKINIAQVYMEYGNYPKALEYFSESLRYLEKNPGNESHVAEIYSNLGDVHRVLRDYDAARISYEKALSYSRQIKDSVAMAGFYSNIGRVQLKNGDTFKAISNGNLAADIYTRAGNKRGLIEVNQLLAEAYYAKNGYEISIAYATTALNQSIELSAHSLYIPALNLLGKNYAALKDYGKAIEYYTQAYQYTKDYGSKIHKLATLNGLFTSYAGRNDYQKAYQYQNEYIALADSVFNTETNKHMSQVQIDYELAKKDEEINRLTRDQEINRLIKYLFIAILMILGITTAFLINRQRKQKLIMQKEKTLLELNLRNRELENKQLAAEIEFKSKELTNHALNLIQKNTFLEDLKEAIISLKKVPADQLPSKVTSLLSQINYSFRLDKDWETFKKHFEHVNEGFFDKLRTAFPELTTQELKLCALIKLELSNKEVATILGITSESVKVARSRLRKKLNLGSEQRIANFLTEATTNYVANKP
jgi:tetratricopeptide (TPR) repeat protein/DNA-binding CsgD family transcriptional regulator